MKKIILMTVLITSLLIPQSAFDDDYRPGVGGVTVGRTTEETPSEETPDEVSEENLTEEEAVPAKIDISAKLPGFIENIFSGRNVKVENVISGDDPEIKGFISNIQSAPFYDKILSFEVTEPGNPSVMLVLYNTESQFLTHVSPIENYLTNIKSIPYPVKDKGVKWHPTENYLIFQSNGLMNRDQLYMVEILDQYLMEDSPIKIDRIEMSEPRGTINHCLYPDFNSTGKDLFFTVRIQKEDKNQRYNRDNNIAWVKDIFSYKETGFSDVRYEVVFDRRFDQKKPVCSPADPHTFAFVSHNKEFREGFGYAEYALVVYNMETKKSSVVESMNGFNDYPYQWSPSGNRIYYTKAMPLAATPRNFRDDRINKINLHAADIRNESAGIRVSIKSNANSNTILGDVATKEYGIAFVNDDLLMMAKFDPYESIFLVDMKKWETGEEFYIKQLPVQLENDFPVLTSDSFYYLQYEYYTNSVVSTVCKIPYEPFVDEAAQRKKQERRAARKAERAGQKGE